MPPRLETDTDDRQHLRTAWHRWLVLLSEHPPPHALWEVLAEYPLTREPRRIDAVIVRRVAPQHWRFVKGEPKARRRPAAAWIASSRTTAAAPPTAAQGVGDHHVPAAPPHPPDASNSVALPLWRNCREASRPGHTAAQTDRRVSRCPSVDRRRAHGGSGGASRGSVEICLTVVDTLRGTQPASVMVHDNSCAGRG